jgi:hypothetical protein
MASGPARSHETARAKSVIEAAALGFPKPGDMAHFVRLDCRFRWEHYRCKTATTMIGWDCTGANVDTGSNSGQLAHFLSKQGCLPRHSRL